MALRRFFPFGSDGGGLQPEERAAYDIGVKRLAEVVHPALRAVVTGGCDPVDGMPFLVTEWVEGRTLSKLLTEGFLTAESAIVLMNQALEVSEILSEVLADDEVWVETAPSAIVIGGGESDRGITFWISPFRWLSTEDTRPGLTPLVDLLEAVMGWQGRKIDDQAGGGLGAWLKWLKENARVATLAEARAALASATQMSAPASPTGKVRSTAKAVVPRRPMVASKPKTSWVGRVVVALLVLTALGLGGLLFYRNHKETSPEAVAAAQEEQEAAKRERSKGALDQVKLPAKKEERETNVQQARGSQPPEADKPEPSKATTKDGQSKVFGPEDFDALLKLEGSKVVLEGTVQEVHLSDSKETLFLNLKAPFDIKWGSGEFDTSPAKAPADRKWMDPLVGKKVRITGEVANRFGHPRVLYTKQADIEIVK